MIEIGRKRRLIPEHALEGRVSREVRKNPLNRNLSLEALGSLEKAHKKLGHPSSRQAPLNAIFTKFFRAHFEASSPLRQFRRKVAPRPKRQ